MEGMLAVTRLASFHPYVFQKDLHTVVVALVDEVKNLRSSVSRSAIFTLGDLFIKIKRFIEPVSSLSDDLNYHLASPPPLCGHPFQEF